MLWVKGFHILAVIMWMGALLYQFQLFAYHNKENALIVQQRFQTMEKRLHFLVAWPACWLTLGTGFWLISFAPAIWSQGWLHIKLVFVLVLFLMQFYAGRVRRVLIKDPYFYSPGFFKKLHHVANIALIIVVFAVVLK